jgi:hypothetical protein
MAARSWLVSATLAGGVALLPASATSDLSSLLQSSRFRAVSPTAHAAAPVLAGQESSSLDDQVELAVTVYNADLALVREVRSIRLQRGISDLQFQDIAATVNPATVHFRSLSEPGRVSVLEQNYEYDLLDPDKLLRKYIGRDVTLIRRRLEGGVARDEEVTARLVSYNGAPVWRIGSEIVTGLHADHMRFPELPGNLFSRPTLIWSLRNDGEVRHRVEASYLASQLSWQADYVLTVGRDEREADLDGWVTLTNRSGTSFREASLQFVAGDVHRVRDAIATFDGTAMRRSVAAPAAELAQQAFGDYHLYSLARRSSINNNETKQVSMLAAAGFPVRKRYVVDGQAFYYRNAHHPGAPVRDQVQVYYEFRNDTKSGLGSPMPAGVVRVYQADSHGAIQFVGEDRLGHTPKDETVNLKIGHAFDVVAERKQTDFQKVGSSAYEVAYAVTLRNHKTAPVTVEVNEPIGGTWRVLGASHPHVKTDAWAARFTVPVPGDGAVTLTYRVRVTY